MFREILFFYYLFLLSFLIFFYMVYLRLVFGEVFIELFVFLLYSFMECILLFVFCLRFGFLLGYDDGRVLGIGFYVFIYLIFVLRLVEVLIVRSFLIVSGLINFYGCFYYLCVCYC